MLYVGWPLKTVWQLQLQLMQNMMARLLTDARFRDCMMPLLKDLHGLPVPFKIKFKALYNLGCAFLRNIAHYKPTCLVGEALWKTSPLLTARIPFNSLEGIFLSSGYEI